MPVIVRVEDLNNIGNGNLTTGALFYASQSGNPFNVNGGQISVLTNANTGLFATATGLQTTGQNLYQDIIGLSGITNNINNSLKVISGGIGVTGVNSITGGVIIAGQGGTVITQNGQTIFISGGSSGGGVVPSNLFTTNINWSLANTFYTSINQSATFTFSNNQDGQSIVVAVTGLNTGIITWPLNIKWPSNSVPTPSTGAVDIYTFVQVTTGIYATVIQNYPY